MSHGIFILKTIGNITVRYSIIPKLATNVMIERLNANLYHFVSGEQNRKVNMVRWSVHTLVKKIHGVESAYRFTLSEWTSDGTSFSVKMATAAQIHRKAWIFEVIFSILSARDFFASSSAVSGSVWATLLYLICAIGTHTTFFQALEVVANDKWDRGQGSGWG